MDTLKPVSLLYPNPETLLRCDDPKCPCQPVPRKPNKRNPPPIEATLHGSKKHGFRQLSQAGIDLDVTFMPLERMVILREKIPGPNPREMSCKTYLQLNSQNSTFVNLQGLADNSLLLTVRIDKAGKYLKPQQKYRCYWPEIGESRLYSDLVLCNWQHKMLRLRLPEPRVKDWKTVALILRTFRRISGSTWSWMINMEDPPAVAGLDWSELGMETRGEVAEESLESSDKSSFSEPGSFEMV